MTAEPDPPEPPRDPADYGRTRLMGPSFWAVIGFGVLCVAAGAGVVAFGPTLFPARPKPAVSAPVAPPAEPARPLSEASPIPQFAAPTSPDRSVELERLSARMDTLEAGQARTAEAAAAALAAAALLDAAQTSRPFAEELAALDHVSPPSAELRALRALAVSGAPSRAALAVEFPEYAARAAGAARTPGEGAGLWARIEAALSRIVMVRRVGEASGNSIDAVLARAERQLNDGDVDHALRTLDALPTPSRQAVEPWTARARTRAEIDRRVSAVRAQALEDLSRLSRGGA